jgi:hypothetical protein
VAPARRKTNRDEETIRSLCAEILNRIKTEGDLDALNEYRTHIRKNVPFFMRSYFAAYLFMELHRAVPSRSAPSQGARPQSARAEGAAKKGRGQEKPSARNEAVRSEAPRNEAAAEKRPRPESSPRNDPPRAALPDGEAARLFFGAGRNRRAYARDLLAFIEQGASVSADVVGEIRVLDNFSFIQVRKEAADDVISALNGAEFRGRPVTVSYAKPKKEDAPAAEAPAAEAPAPFEAEAAESLPEDPVDDASADSPEEARSENT